MKKIKQVDHICIPSDDYVTAKLAGNIIEITHAERVSPGGYISKVDKEHYVDLRTGELKQFMHTTSRADDAESVSKSLSRLRDYLNTNITCPENCKWLTLTYAENMTDTHQLLTDFASFNRRCRKAIGPYEYITVCEPQGRGAWHHHVVLIFPSRAPFMDNATVAKLWKKGFVSVRKLENVDNVGAYLTAYLGDMELEEFQRLNPTIEHFGELKELQSEEDGKTTTKRYVKGARLSMYPPGFHLYRCSKNIRPPQKYRIPYNIAKEKFCGDHSPTYRRSIMVTDGDFTNRITREYYNRARKNKEDLSNGS